MVRMKFIDKLKNRLSYRELEPFCITSEIREAYSTGSVCGGTLRGLNAVVTGGGSGIGFAIAKRLVVEGCTVVIIGRNAEKLGQAQEQLGNVSVYAWDVSKIQELDKALTAIEALFDSGKIDIWVNSHGIFSIYDRKRSFCNVPMEGLEEVMSINLNSTYALNMYVANRLSVKNYKGHILNIASICAYMNSSKYTPYGMSKSGVVALTKELGNWYNKKGIIINAIAPGSCATSMIDLGENVNIASPINVIKRVSMPEEIAALAAIMVSPFGDSLYGAVVTASACEQF